MRSPLVRAAKLASFTLASAALGLLFAGAGCSGSNDGSTSSGSGSGDCCEVDLEGLAPACLCREQQPIGSATCFTRYSGRSCTVTCSQGVTTVAGTGSTVSSCAGQPVVCSSTSTVASGTGGSNAGAACADAYPECVDGNRYSFSCSGGSCVCVVNEEVTKTVSGATCPGTAFENSICGWDLAYATGDAG